MTHDELREKLRTDPALGVTLRLVNGMNEEEVWARAVEWAAQQEAEWAARVAEEFVPAPVEPPADPVPAPVEPPADPVPSPVEPPADPVPSPVEPPADPVPSS